MRASSYRNFHRASRLAFLVAAALSSAPAHARTGPSDVLIPAQKIPLNFSHKMHLHMKLQCDFCHARAESSTASSDFLFPTEDACRTCHKIERDKPEKDDIPEARCDACHQYPEPGKGGADPKNQAVNDAGVPVIDWDHPLAVDAPAPQIKFNHKVHVDRKIACTYCHSDVAEVKLATRDQLPRMPLCLGCHSSTVSESNKKNRAPARCSTCHLTGFDGTMQTQFATGTLTPSGTWKGDAHTLDFVKNHAQVAASDEKYCESCHRRDFCLSCHNGVVKPLSFHGNDYVSLHAIDARKASLRCDGCHRRQTFCLGCHERLGVTDSTTVAAPNGLDKATPPRRFHPPFSVWVQPPRTPEHHSWEAERNLKQCVACHRAETCLECHSATTGPGHLFQVSPHPPGFAGSATCRSIAGKNGRVCLQCHAPTDAHLSCQ